jgi:hypothetical protein
MFTCFVLSFVLVIGLGTWAIAAVPNITGTWTGSGRVIDLKGQVDSPVPVVFVVQTQKGNLLRGYIEFTFSDGSDRFNFTGAIKGKALTLAGVSSDQRTGFIFGTLNDNKIQLQASSCTDGTVSATVTKVTN